MLAKTYVDTSYARTRTPAACAAAGLAPTATKRRPTIVARIVPATSRIATTAMITTFGMPSVFSRAKRARAGGAAAVEAPLVIWKTTPCSSALTPSVATSGVILNHVTATPLISPEATQASRIRAKASGRRSSWPFGTLVTMIVVNVIIPGTERSSPRCWITSVWPMPAIARMAANGSMESRALWLTLPGASRGLTANSTAVATQMAEKRGMRRRGRTPALPLHLGRGARGSETTVGDTGATALSGTFRRRGDGRSDAATRPRDDDRLALQPPIDAGRFHSAPHVVDRCAPRGASTRPTLS